jgi:sugar/nucleoside kinase (ribokinase family)
VSASNRGPHVICCGASTFDTIFRVSALPQGGGKIFATQAVQVAHGMALSAATTVAKLGGRSALFSRVGADADGERIIEELTAAGVDASHVRRIVGQRSPISTVLVDAIGERLVIPFYDPSLDRSIDWLPLDRIAAADAVLVDVRWPEGAAAVLRAARDAAIPAILDADVGPVAVIRELAALATHVVFSEPAAYLLSAARQVPEVLMELARQIDGFLAITAGPDGCYWFDRGTGHSERLAAPVVIAVDTLAAGDVFHGAFALALAEGKDESQALAFANVAAALKCRSFGGRLGTPSREEVDQRLALALRSDGAS